MSLVQSLWLLLMYYVMKQMCTEQLLFFVYLSKAFVDLFSSVLCSFEFTCLCFVFSSSIPCLPCVCMHTHLIWGIFWRCTIWSNLPCNQLSHQTHSYLSGISEISLLQAILLTVCVRMRMCVCACLCMHRVWLIMDQVHQFEEIACERILSFLLLLLTVL